MARRRLLISSIEEIDEIFRDVVGIVKEIRCNYHSKDPDDLLIQLDCLLDAFEIIHDWSPRELKEFVEDFGLEDLIKAIQLHHSNDISISQICCSIMGCLTNN